MRAMHLIVSTLEGISILVPSQNNSKYFASNPHYLIP